MTSERFHKAAKDCILEILKEATRKDCNTRDDSGMTPTLWAAFEGHIEALRMLVARGGDPDKADYFGNTALHLSSARGHELCVRFLVKFGCNIWSLDIDRHSARELAAINGRDRILQLLDQAQADQELNNRKKSRMMKEKAEKDAEKRLKEYVKRQKSAELRAEKEQKKLLKRLDSNENGLGPVIALRPVSSGASLKSRTYSDIVGTATKRHGTSAVGRRAALAKRPVDDFKVVEIEVDGKKSVRSLTGLRRDSEVMYVGTYGTNAIIDARMGPLYHHQQQQQHQHQLLQQQQQHLQHQPMVLRRGRISDVWGTLNKARSTPDLLGDRRCLEEEEEEEADEEEPREGENDGDEDDEDDGGSSVVERGFGQQLQRRAAMQEPGGSIFNRPGFGSVAFRRSIAATLDNLPVTQVEIHRQPNGDHLYPGSANNSSNGSSVGEQHRNHLNNNHLNHHNHNNNNNNHHNNNGNGHNEEISIGSAGSLARRQSMWDDDLLSEEEETDEEWTPLQRFLVANNLSSIHPVLESEQIDLEALMLLTESDVVALRLPLGPHRKLLHAIASRKKALETQEAVIKDIKL